MAGSRPFLLRQDSPGAGLVAILFRAWPRIDKFGPPISLMAREPSRLFYNITKRGLEEAIAKDALKREPKWTEVLAVGSETFVTGVEGKARARQRVEVVEESGAWILRESYESTSGPENRAIAAF